MGEKAELATGPLPSIVPVHEGYKVLGGVVLYQKHEQGGTCVATSKTLRPPADDVVDAGSEGLLMLRCDGCDHGQV